MSRRKAVLDNEKRLIEKLKNLAFDDLKLEIDDDTPDDLLEAIRDAYDEPGISGGGDSAAQIASGQPYRLTDSDDFPFGTYVQNQTGRIVTKHFRISDEYQIKQAPFMEIVATVSKPLKIKSFLSDRFSTFLPAFTLFAFLLYASSNFI